MRGQEIWGQQIKRDLSSVDCYQWQAANASARKPATTALGATAAAEAAGFATTTTATTAAAFGAAAAAATVIAAEQIHGSHGWVGLTASAAAGFVAKGVDTALRTQVRVGTWLVIFFKLTRWLSVMVVVSLRVAVCGRWARATVIASGWRRT